MTARHTVVQVALGRRLLLHDLYTQPVLIESIAEECDLLSLCVYTANSHPNEIILESDELYATLTLDKVAQRVALHSNGHHCRGAIYHVPTLDSLSSMHDPCQARLNLVLAPVVQRTLVSPDDSELLVKFEHSRLTYALESYRSQLRYTPLQRTLIVIHD